MAHPPCIENYALAVSARKHITSEQALAGLDFQENDEAAKFELTYSTLNDITERDQAFGMIGCPAGYDSLAL
jgi:hypothetical protein